MGGVTYWSAPVTGGTKTIDYQRTAQGNPPGYTPSFGSFGNIAAPRPSVQGVSTGGGGGGVQQVSQPSGGGGGGGGDGGGGGVPDYAEQLRNEISSAWDSYISSLEGIGNQFLPEQRTSQENIVKSQLEQGQKTIGSQQVKSLRDIGTNIRNAFQAGNIYLGTRGAGDSSAANQYSFAIQQQAQKQTAQLNEFVNLQLNNLQAQHDQKVNEIALWFSQSQQRLKEMAAQGQIGKAQDLSSLGMNLLNQAIAASNQVRADTTTRYNALVEWAANNSQNLQQLTSNIAGIPQALGGVQIDSRGNIAQQPVGQDTTRKRSIFG